MFIPMRLLFLVVCALPLAKAQDLSSQLTGKTVQLRAVVGDGLYVNVRDGRELWLSRKSSCLANFEKNTTFKITPGLVGYGVSFESVLQPGHFLHNTRGDLRMTRDQKNYRFHAAASFVPRQATTHANGFTFESVSEPDHFVQHRQFRMVIRTVGAQDAIFNTWYLDHAEATPFGSEQQIAGAVVSQPDVVRLSANGQNNGRLIAVAKHDSGFATYYESLDDGASWERFSTTQQATDANLFEVPQTVGFLYAGSLLSATVVRDTSGPGPATSAIRINLSGNLAQSWQYHSVPVQQVPGLIADPALMVDGNGELALFYTRAEGSARVLVRQSATDGFTWGAPQTVVQLGALGKFSIVQAAADRYVMAYETCDSDCAVFLRTSSNGRDWGPVDTTGTKPSAQTGRFFAGAPVLSRISAETSNSLSFPNPGAALILSGANLRETDGSASDQNGRVFFINPAGSDQWLEMKAPILSLNSATSGNSLATPSTFVPTLEGDRVHQVTVRNGRVLTAPTFFDNPVHSGNLILRDPGSNRTLAWSSGQLVLSSETLGSKWHLNNLGNGEYHLANTGTNRLLKYNNDGSLELADPAFSECERWNPRLNANGTATFTAVVGGQVLTVDGVSEFALQPTSGHTFMNAAYNMISVADGRLISRAPCEAIAGEQPTLETEDAAGCNTWFLRQGDDGFFFIHGSFSAGPLTVVDCESDGPCAADDNAPLAFSAGPETERQQWAVEQQPNGSVRLINRFSGKDLVAGGCSDSGSNVLVQKQRGDDPCHFWYLNLRL
ncbi:AbfB domain-containing protein [Acanthopleuribacter pedis]|uniref:AbfB domain-containing protein n=1 Tax=Acanthopleuribacter pedis TaxID=442870 RepID=A0A8J7Q6P0_9BACT|nr:AbfB domain-containing protein [Acanthopleuribacter pedis]MBO1317734.1 AbfB domain-containing protein [Acanthopleuribacter pedis]